MKQTVFKTFVALTLITSGAMHAAAPAKQAIIVTNDTKRPITFIDEAGRKQETIQSKKSKTFHNKNIYSPQGYAIKQNGSVHSFDFENHTGGPIYMTVSHSWRSTLNIKIRKDVAEINTKQRIK